MSGGVSIRNTINVVSVDGFFKLSKIGALTGIAVPNEGSVAQALVVEGLCQLTKASTSAFTLLFVTGNRDLVSMNSLLSVFSPQDTLEAGYGVYIANNSALCIAVNTWWSSRVNSYIAFPVDAVCTV